MNLSLILAPEKQCLQIECRVFDLLLWTGQLYLGQMADIPFRSDVIVAVQVQPLEQSSHDGTFSFVYFIEIANLGEETVQLLSREWFIHDGNGEVTHVEGEGVVGAQPILESGAVHRYNSLCPLKNPPGFMRGSYTFSDSNQELFKVEIPAFALRVSSIESLN